tara:strand:+ start:1834 stop:3126 length:1293 start_codon:yes stop_codon:yes gene_type:complete
MHQKNFIIKKNDGILFSKISGDTNKIHLDENVGYNSLFGEKICHGSLVLIKSFQILNLNKLIKDKNNIRIKFIKHFCYNKKITIKSKILKNIIIFELIQSRDLRGFIEIKYSDDMLNNVFNKVSKKFIPKKTITNYYEKINKMGTISMLLCSLTKYVGTIYPGENSIINEINIRINNSFIFNKNFIHIYSKKLDKRIPLILNKLTFGKYNIEFNTSERSVFNSKLSKINNHIKKKVNAIKENVLIIGASSGIGFDVLNILKINKKIKIFATYNNNKIHINNKNIFKVKIDLTRDIHQIKKILKENGPLTIYYFATPKINIGLNNKNEKSLYKNFYIDFPLKIISMAKNIKINFFYPSTTFIEVKNNSHYAQVKKLGESILKKMKSKNLKINICRISEINTKQNLSLFPKKLPNFRDLLNSNRLYQSLFFN